MTRRRGNPTVVLVLACTAWFMVILDVSIVNVALPSIRAALHFSQTQLEWVVNAYTLTFAGLLLLGGRMGDLLGRRTMLIAGLAVFTAASLLGGLLTEGLDWRWILFVNVSLLAATGMGLSFVPTTIAAVSGVAPAEAGLASGLLNTARQIGGSLGLAILATIAASRTAALLANHHATADALTAGYHRAFMVAAGFALCSALAAFLLVRPGRRVAAAMGTSLEAAA